MVNNIRYLTIVFSIICANTIASSFASSDHNRAQQTNDITTESHNDEDHYDMTILQEEEGQQQSQHRNLQAIDLLCSLLASSLPSEVGCSCSFNLASLGNIGLDFQCNWNEPNCLILFCATPTLTGTIELLSGTSSIELCYTGGTISHNTILPEFCINLMGNDEVLSISDNIESINNNNNMMMISSISSCSAHVENKECNSCISCNDGRGILFDCTNIHPNIIQSQCSDIQLPKLTSRTSFNTSTKKIIILPKLDSTKHSQ